MYGPPRRQLVPAEDSTWGGPPSSKLAASEGPEEEALCFQEEAFWCNHPNRAFFAEDSRVECSDADRSDSRVECSDTDRVLLLQVQVSPDVTSRAGKKSSGGGCDGLRRCGGATSLVVLQESEVPEVEPEVATS